MPLQGTRRNRYTNDPAAVRAPTTETVNDLITQEMADRMFADGIIPTLASAAEVAAGDSTTKVVSPADFAANLRIPYAFHFPGTMAANAIMRFTIPFDAQLVHVSAVASNNSDATLKIGDSLDDDKILVAVAIGDSGTPATFTSANWAVTNPNGYYSLGDIAVFTLDYDGAAGTAAQNVTIVATLVRR